MWKAPSIAGREVHIHLRPDVIEDFRVRLEERSLAGNTKMVDSQEMIDNQTTCCRSDQGLYDFSNCYHTLEEVMSR